MKPLGGYLTRVLDGALPGMGWVERPLYRLAGVDPREDQNWLFYALALLAFNLAGVLVLTRSSGCRPGCRSTRLA